MITSFCDENSLAECVGLWIAEGDSKSTRELTFTNNCEDLIKYFHTVVTGNFEFKTTPRVYEYSSNYFSSSFRLDGVVKKKYLDFRARKPYYIYRICDAKLLRDWKKCYSENISKREVYVSILRGVFAGEGNIKYQEECAGRTVRLAQKKRNSMIECFLDHAGIAYSYAQENRQYYISRRKNLEIFRRLQIAALHPDKNVAFEKMFSSYKLRGHE